MKKIVFLRTNPNAVGGAEKYLSRLRQALQDKGIKSEIRFFKGNQSTSSWLKALMFNSKVCKAKQKDEFYFSLERVSCADIYRAGDGVHKVYRKTKSFWWLNPLNFIYVYLEKKCFLNSKKIIANSNLIKDQIIKTYNIDPEKITTIYNGVDLPSFIEKRTAKMAVCEEYKIDNTLPLILFVGSGFKRKGVKEFLEILSSLKEKLNFNSIVVGGDKNFNKYKLLAKRLGLKTIFTGKEKNVAKFYEASDLFLFPTHYEPFSNVVLEALSFGCVCITTAQNGASEILDDEFVMSSPNDKSILKTIERVLKNGLYLKKLSSISIQTSKNFSIEKNAKLTMEAIDEILC